MTGSDTRSDVQQAAAAENGPPPDAQHLLAGIEPQLNEVIEAAVARVAEIEKTAVAEAQQLVARTQQEARESYATAIDRSSDLVRRLEVLAAAVNDLTSLLRTETEGVVGDLRGMRQEASRWAAEAQPQPPAAQPEPQPQAQTPAPSAPATEPLPPPPEPEVEPSPELTDLFRERIVHMRRDGKPREEAERVLLRFRLGHRFLGMLDEIYATDPRDLDSRKQGFIGKLRSRS